MLVPLSWLKEYVDISLSPNELAERLSASGSSVEHIVTIGEGLGQILVAKVLDVYPHPNADRLRLAKIDTGSAQLEVVCGAANLATGQTVAFAPVGAFVPVNMHDPERHSFVLEAAKIRGIVSNGMICSSAELGLGEAHEGILVLPNHLETGQPLSQALGYPQTVFDIEITTNRADELSMVGIAREIGVLTNQGLRTPEPDIKEGPGDGIGVVIDSNACSRFMAQTLKVKVGPSPWWLQQRLMLAGMRPINNVVDVTNYVMLELGQPLHAYDVAKLSGQILTARQAKEGETITTLDGTVRTLTPSMLVIADQQMPVAVAGIMGGQASMISESSTTITLEAAVFDPVAVRRAANSLALRSEASKRFERSVDAVLTAKSLARATELLVQLAAAEPVGGVQDVYPRLVQSKQFSLSQQKLNKYMGKDFPLSHAQKILQALGFKANPTNQTKHDSPSAILFQVPSWRLRDIEGEEDLIEEVVRIVGYDQLPVILPAIAPSGRILNPKYQGILTLKQQASQAGWTEAITVSLTSQEQINLTRAGQTAVAITNPLSTEWTHLRLSLLPGLLNVAGQNSRVKPVVRHFEIANIFLPGANLPAARTTLALVMTGVPIELAAAELKGMIRKLLCRFGGEVGFATVAAAEIPEPFAPGSIKITCDGTPLGYAGGLTETARRSFDVPETTLAAELSIDSIVAKPGAVKFVGLPKYPSVEEDLSLLMPEDMPLGQAIDLIRQAAGDMLDALSATSVYRHPSLGRDKKSPLLHVRYRHPNRTLTSTELAQVRQQVAQTLRQHQIEIRA